MKKYKIDEDPLMHWNPKRTVLKTKKRPTPISAHQGRMTIVMGRLV